MSDPRTISQDSHLSMKAFAENLPHLDPRIVDGERMARAIMMLRSSDFDWDIVGVYRPHFEILQDCHCAILQMHEDVTSTPSPEYQRVIDRIVEAIEHYENGKKNSGKKWE